MGFKTGEGAKKMTMPGFFILALTALFFYGCNFFADFQKEAKEEKRILGYVNGFNPRLKDIERALQEGGFNPGSVDGIMDKQTRKAVREFQKANRLQATSFIDAKTKEKLESLSLQRAKKKQEAAAQGGKTQVKPADKLKKTKGADTNIKRR
jgi:peptidoglycan hydrolase-like protein with peptidoglycan-binding domain